MSGRFLDSPEIDEMARLILEFSELQRGLVTTLEKEGYLNRGFPSLAGSTKRGTILYENAKWDFWRHGVGYEFKNEKGVIVDAHDNIGDSEFLDPWR